MSLPANNRKLRIAVRQVKAGLLSVSRSGKVCNLVTGKRIGRKPSKSGYHNITITDTDGRRYGIRVHRLVFALYVRFPTQGMEVNHKDGIKSHNGVRNLEEVTCSSNMQHAVDTGLIEQRLGERGHNATLTNNEVSAYRRAFARNEMTREQISTDSGLKQHTVCNFLSGRTYPEASAKHLDVCQTRLQNARSPGKPAPTLAAIAKVMKLRRKGLTHEAIATKLRVGKTTVRRYIARSKMLDKG